MYGDDELGGDLLVRLALGHEIGYTLLGRRQRSRRRSASADTPELRLCPHRPERCAELLEGRERTPERLAGCPALALLSLNRSQREQRARALERHRKRALVFDCLLEPGKSGPGVSPGREVEAFGTRDQGTRPVPPELLGLVCEDSDGALALGHPARRGQRLHQIDKEAGDSGLSWPRSWAWIDCASSSGSTALAGEPSEQLQESLDRKGAEQIDAVSHRTGGVPGCLDQLAGALDLAAARGDESGTGERRGDP